MPTKLNSTTSTYQQPTQQQNSESGNFPHSSRVTRCKHAHQTHIQHSTMQNEREKCSKFLFFYSLLWMDTIVVVAFAAAYCIHAKKNVNCATTTTEREVEKNPEKTDCGCKLNWKAWKVLHILEVLVNAIIQRQLDVVSTTTQTRQTTIEKTSIATRATLSENLRRYFYCHIYFYSTLPYITVKSRFNHIFLQRFHFKCVVVLFCTATIIWKLSVVGEKDLMRFYISRGDSMGSYETTNNWTMETYKINAFVFRIIVARGSTILNIFIIFTSTVDNMSVVAERKIDANIVCS